MDASLAHRGVDVLIGLRGCTGHIFKNDICPRRAGATFAVRVRKILSEIANQLDYIDATERLSPLLPEVYAMIGGQLRRPVYAI